jgi:hypothetical protein
VLSLQAHELLAQHVFRYKASQREALRIRLQLLVARDAHAKSLELYRSILGPRYVDVDRLHESLAGLQETFPGEQCVCSGAVEGWLRTPRVARALLARADVAERARQLRRIRPHSRRCDGHESRHVEGGHDLSLRHGVRPGAERVAG